MSDNELKAILAKTIQTVDKMAERIDKMAESNVKVDEAVEKMVNQVKETSATVGNLGGRIGILVEMLLVPGICPAMNERGHNFVRVCPNTRVRKEKLHTQIDLMLYNTTEAMAVEIKTHIDKEDVEWHIHKHLTAVRELEKEFGIEDKVLLGAVAGISIDNRARNCALQNGLYVIEIQENEKIPLKIESPKDNKPKTW